MASLKLKGDQDLHEITPEEAKYIRSIWNDDGISKDQKLNVGTICFEKRDIKMINEAGGEFEGSFMYDPYDSEHKKAILAFEREWNVFVAYQPDELKTFEEFMKSRKICFYGSEPKKAQSGVLRYDQNSVKILDHKKYGNYQKLWSAYNYLGYLREKAKLHEKLDENYVDYGVRDEYEIDVKELPF